MEDQFGGRTDDDLFYDDFEPVDSEPIVVQEEAPYIQEPSPVAPVAPLAPEPAQARQSKPGKSSPPAQASNSNAPSPSPSPSSSQPPQSQSQSQTQPQSKGGNLSSSRFARKGNFNMRQQSTPPPPPPPATKSPAPPKESKEKEQGQEKEKDTKGDKEKDGTPPPNAPTTPAKDKKPHAPSQNTAANAEARLQSGANPRQKLTEEELAAKMEKMKLLSAEKTRQFERAEKDEQQHAQAYARGMEEARKRRAEEAERRRRGEEEKRKLDDERAKNRERKLKAMGMKEGGWDEGKEAILEEEARRGFKGANGGIRGTKRGGLGGSRYSREVDDQPDVDRFLDDRQRSRGRGRGGRGGGRGRGSGRGGFDGSLPKPNDSSAPAPSLTVEDFPALPSDGTRKPTGPTAPVAYPPKAAPAPIPALPSPSPAGGKWDDEMEALDELRQQGES